VCDLNYSLWTAFHDMLQPENGHLTSTIVKKRRNAFITRALCNRFQVSISRCNDRVPEKLRKSFVSTCNAYQVSHDRQQSDAGVAARIVNHSWENGLRPVLIQ
jgi:translation initiation factor 2B subunit (eIF-2B alpha/beta/delta family)